MNSCVYSGLRWLITSGIQDRSGGVSRFYEAESRAYQGLSVSSTGYYISALIKANEAREEEPIEHARAAGRFLSEEAFDPTMELFPMEPGGDEPRLREARFLDCCIALRGLLHLWQATSDRMFLDRAERCGEALRARMSRVDGSFFPILNLTSGEARAGTGSWAVEAEVYQLKSALAFLELSEATGNKEFEAATRLTLQWCLKRHEGFVGGGDDSPEAVMDRLHAYCYFLEGLLPVAADNMAASHALQHGVLRVENLMKETAAHYQRCDVVAQLLRLRLYADRIGIMELDSAQAESEAEVLEQFQHQSTDPKLDGGFVFARRQGRLTAHVNPATTAFAIQSLAMWEQAGDGAFREPWQSLI